MPTSGADRPCPGQRPSGSLVRPRLPGVLSVVLAAVLTAGLAGCSSETSSPSPSSSSGPPVSSEALSVPPVVADALARLLRSRARAVRAGDSRSFLRSVDRSDPTFVASQRAYFANLSQLPLRTYRYTLNPATIVRDDADYWAVVTLTLEIEGYDTRPATAPDRFRFSPVPGHSDRFRVSSVTDADWELRNEVVAEPWDLGPVLVRRGSGVLGIFDEGSVGYATSLLASFERGLGQLAGEVPYPWPHSVVVVALSDNAYLTSLHGLPGRDPARLDAVAVPVAASPGSTAIAATRIVLNPAMLDRAGAARDRLVRHELTHVALGRRDDLAPVWLSEGLAEYVSVRAMAPQDRRIPRRAVSAAGDGVDALPSDAEFNDLHAPWHYALAWWACEYLADNFGEGSLWLLLDEFRGDVDDPDAVLQSYFGLDSADLARRAGRLLLATYRASRPDDGPHETAQPSPSPSTPSSSPEPGEADEAGGPASASPDSGGGLLP